MVPSQRNIMANNRKTRRELTNENERLAIRLDWLEKNIFGETATRNDHFRLPPPGHKTISHRIELLETKIDLILDHLDLKVKAVPNSVVLKKKNKKKELVVTRKVTDA